MILHVLCDKLNRSILCSVNYRLALTEENCRLEVCCSSRFLILRLLVAVVESLLEVCNLTVLSCKLCILAVQVAAEVVDTCVQTVDFSLVTTLCDSEVVCTVRVTELVNNTCVQLEVREISVVLEVVGCAKFATTETPDNSRLYVNLTCLILTEVES